MVAELVQAAAIVERHLRLVFLLLCIYAGVAKLVAAASSEGVGHYDLGSSTLPTRTKQCFRPVPRASGLVQSVANALSRVGSIPS